MGIKFNAQLMRDTSAQMSHGSLCQKLMVIKLQGGYSDIFARSIFFLVQNSEFQYFLGGFRNMNIFGGY